MGATINSFDCEYPHLVGDGNCDDFSNTEECEFDGGDCCNVVNLGCIVETSTVEEISSTTNMDVITMFDTGGIALLTVHKHMM